jgi:hypothetical protein
MNLSTATSRLLRLVPVPALLALPALAAPPPWTPLHLDVLALPGGATPGSSSAANAAIVLVAVTNARGGPVGGLGATTGDGSVPIALPSGWRLETHARPLGDARCALQPTFFGEVQTGVYLLRVAPGGCAWRSGGYGLGVQFQSVSTKARLAGAANGAFGLTGFDAGLLVNGDFDRDVAGWSGPGTSWINEDAGARPGSGALASVIREGVICEGIVQCVRAESGRYEISADVRTTTGRQGQAGLGLGWFATTDCSGTALNTTEEPLPPPTPAGAWTRLTYAETSPLGVHSVQAILASCKADNDTFGTARIDFDRVRLLRLDAPPAAASGVAAGIADALFGEAEPEAIVDRGVHLDVEALPATAAAQGTAPGSSAWILVTATRTDTGQAVLDLAGNAGDGSAAIPLPTGWKIDTVANPVGVPACAVAVTAVRNLRPAGKGAYLFQVTPAVPGCRWYRGDYAFALRFDHEKGGLRTRGVGLVKLAVP